MGFFEGTGEDLKGRVAIVTGAARGMGRAVALALGARGASIAVNDRDAGATEDALAALTAAGITNCSAPADITSGHAVRQMIEKVHQRFGRIDILVNNAGILYPTAVPEISEDEWDRVMAVNLKGTFLCAQAVLPAMKTNNWGRIVNFSSTAGKNVSTVGGAHYTASKAGVLGFTRHLAREVASHGITVNAVCPGLIDTEMVRATISAERIQNYVDGYPVSRLGTPGEVAELVAFLASDRAAYITGASLDINGGDLMI